MRASGRDRIIWCRLSNERAHEEFISRRTHLSLSMPRRPGAVAEFVARVAGVGLVGAGDSGRSLLVLKGA